MAEETRTPLESPGGEEGKRRDESRPREPGKGEAAGRGQRAVRSPAAGGEGEPGRAEGSGVAAEEAGPRTLTDLKDLGEAAGEPAVPEPSLEREPRIDALGRAYATGKRKNAVARVWIKPGGGRITVNGQTGEDYFARPVLRMLIRQPFVAADRAERYDVWCTVKGGGLSGQAGALRHGISRALTNYEPELRPPLKAGGFLVRDARVVERKKYGRHKARRSVQFSKR